MTTDRKVYMADYYARNREALREKQRATRASNKDRDNARSAEWRRANPEQADASIRAWVAAHPEQKRAATRAWRAAHPESRVRQEHRRRAVKRGAVIVPFTPDQELSRRRYLGDGCWICGIRSVVLTWDHVKPLAAGGAHALANLRLACSRCNSTKGSKWYGTNDLAQLVSEVADRTRRATYEVAA
jgi:5-methylcytosine-specific restriction endonuclease McrA